MCVYDELEFPCGHFEWGVLTQACQRAVDDGFWNCDIRTPGNQVYIAEELCKSCSDIGTPVNPPIKWDMPSRAKREDHSSKERHGYGAQIAERALDATSIQLLAKILKESEPDTNWIQPGTSYHESVQEEGSLVSPTSNLDPPTGSVSKVIKAYGSQPGGGKPSSPVLSDSENSESYPDLDPDIRFLEPQKYFSELQSIEAAVVERSALYLF